MALLSALGLVAWQIQAQASGTWVLMAWFFGALCLAGVAYGVPRQALVDGRLFWSGEAWFWESAAARSADVCPESVLVSLSVALDSGSGLLLWVCLPKGPGQGLGQWASAWTQESAMPSKWHGFRCAVYSRPKTLRTSDSTYSDRL